MRYALLTDWEPRFNPNTVDGFIREYRDTIAFAKLTASDNVASEVKDSGEEEVPYIAKVGDYVQWEHNGVLGFSGPTKVKGISPDGNYAYVDGQNGAVPIHELVRESAPMNAQNSLDPKLVERNPPPPKIHMQEFVVPLSNGNKAVFQWPTALTKEDVEDLEDSLKMLERKITRPAPSADTTEASKKL